MAWRMVRLILFREGNIRIRDGFHVTPTRLIAISAELLGVNLAYLSLRTPF